WARAHRGATHARAGLSHPTRGGEGAGCAALLRARAARDPAAPAGLPHRGGAPPAEVNDAATKRERVARAGAVATGAAGGGNETAKAVMIAQPDRPMVLLPAIAAWSLVGVGVAVVLLAPALIVPKPPPPLPHPAPPPPRPPPARPRTLR